MSHSKWRKFGQSYWLERSGSYKKYINTCIVCGAKGYDPVIEDAEHKENKKSVIFREMMKTLSALALDEIGRCADCAKIQDSSRKKE